jgi:polygalacturonase
MTRRRLSLIGSLLGLALFGCASEPKASQAPPLSPADAIKVALPQIPSKKFNILDFGAVADAKTDNTEAIKKAIAAVAAAGGGQLEVPAGTFITKSFNLTSKLDLHLDAGAILKMPDSLTDWGLPDPATAKQADIPRFDTFAIIYGSGLTDVAITGAGTIDGSGQLFWIWSDKAARKYPAGRLVYPRPRMVVLRKCTRVHVDGPTFTNSPMFHLAIGNQSQDVLIENIRVFAPSDAPNTDAVDPGGTRIIVRNCEIDTGDDNVAIQGNSHDVLIENLTCLHGHGISIGSATTGGISNVYVRHCSFDGADNGIRIKSVRGRGGEVHDIHYTDITMKNVARPFDINMLYNGNANAKTDIGPRDPEGQPKDRIPNFHDIEISNLTVTRAPLAGRILGLPEQPAKDITFTNCHFQADKGFTVQDAQNVRFVNTTFDIAIPPVMTTDNATVTQTPQ